MRQLNLTLLFILGTAPFFGGCAKSSSDGGVVGQSPTSEQAYCTAVQTYSNAITITGSAVYKRRVFLSGGGLGDVDSVDYPIKYAEVRVTDKSTGADVQCTETDGNGGFQFQTPNNGAILTVSVNSRADNNKIKASVLNNPTQNFYYALTGSFTANATQTLSTLVASHKGDFKGGAFNILDMIYKANEFLRTQTANCANYYSGCAPVTVASKVKVFWTPGFNPSQYLGLSVGLSYYKPGTGELYILGGINGDTDYQDTDHFDNAVIVHEYGHFIEDIYGKSDSPGGVHNGNSVLDARLAWGEGWADFFSSAVLGDPVYRDTKGNIDGSTAALFNVNVETNSPSMDVPTANGEGNFREFSITRALWDDVDFVGTLFPDSDSDGVQGSFGELWAVFSGPFKVSARHFRNYGLFMELHNTLLTGPTAFSTILTAEKQRADRLDYAGQDTVPGGTCTHTIAAVADDGSFSKSNQFYNNDFYHYEHSGGTLTINLTKNSGTADLDLYLYKEKYTYGASSDWIAKSDDPASTDGGTEDIAISLAAGTYMINVKVYTGLGPGTSTVYTLMANGEQICP